MAVSDFLYEDFINDLGFAPTDCQCALLRKVADFVTSDEDLMVVNGYAGTGKTTAFASVITTFVRQNINTVLLAPTGRAAKVLSSYANRPAYTIHKKIYRQKGVNGDGWGEFSIAPNKDKNTLYIVDEVSLIGVDTSTQNTASFGSGNLLEDLVSYVRNGDSCKLILIGDSAQLPPIGLDCSPALNHDWMVMMGATVFAELKTVVRQQHESGILHNATLLRNIIGDGYDIVGYDFDGSISLTTEGFDDVSRITGGELIEKITDAYATYGEDETIILCRSNKRANRYNAGIRSTVQFKEEQLVRDDKLMIVKNCYQFCEDLEDVDYIANGDIAKLVKISRYEERYGLQFAEARLSLPDYNDQEIVAKVILDTLNSETASLSFEQQNMLYQGVDADYGYIKSKRKRYQAVREDHYYNALQLKYANAITCHKSQGGQWDCVFIDNPFWQDLTLDDLKWLYTAITRAKKKVYFVNFKDEYFQ